MNDLCIYVCIFESKDNDDENKYNEKTCFLINV